MTDLFGPFSFSTGVVRNKNLAYLLATKDDLVKEGTPHTRVYYRFNGNWFGVDLNWTATSASVCVTPEERFICTGDHGIVQVIGGGVSVEETIGSQPVFRSDRGPLREVRGIARGHAYAVGTKRQAYRRVGANKWVCIDESIQTPGADLTETSFESIDGFNESDIYAVGWEGEIWRYNGSIWRQLKSPTKLALYKVRCGSDGAVYACGQSGTLLCGRDNDWRIIEHGATTEDFWGLEWFGGKPYVSTAHFVYALNGKALERVTFDNQRPPATCYHLSAADGIMWSIGAKDVMEFDGNQWARVI